MHDEPDPPRKFYKLKEAEFERVNLPHRADDAATPENVQQMIDAANVRPHPGPAAPSRASAHNEVHDILHDNLARANAAGLNDLAPKPKRASRRKRDYWFLFLTVNAFFGAALAFFGWRTLPGVSACAGIIFFSCSLTWVMWFVMDDY